MAHHVVAIFAVYRLGLVLQLEIVCANGMLHQYRVEPCALQKLGYHDLATMDANALEILSRELLSVLRIVNGRLELHIV